MGVFLWMGGEMVGGVEGGWGVVGAAVGGVVGVYGVGHHHH